MRYQTVKPWVDSTIYNQFILNQNQMKNSRLREWEWLLSFVGFITISNLTMQPNAESRHSCWRAVEALKCRWRGPSTVTCTKHFNSCHCNEPFQEVNCDVYQPTRQIGDDCSILTVSEWKQGIQPLLERRLLSLPSDETPPPPVITINSWFGVTVQRNDL